MMLRFNNTKSSMLYNLLRLDKARCFILDKLLDKTTIQRWSAARGRSAVTPATCGLEEPFFQLCCCVSFLFWREIGFGFTYYLCT
jgi:hypothetical protein